MPSRTRDTGANTMGDLSRRRLTRVFLLVVVLGFVLAASVSAQGVATTVINETPDTLDIFAVVMPHFGWPVAMAVAPGDTVLGYVDPRAIGPDRMFQAGVRVKGTETVHLTNRHLPGLPLHIRKKKRTPTGRVGT